MAVILCSMFFYIHANGSQQTDSSYPHRISSSSVIPPLLSNPSISDQEKFNFLKNSLKIEYDQAIVHNEIKAQCNLGQLYCLGLNGSEDFALARYWFERAALQGDTKAQYNLAQLYSLGRGGTRDYTLARYWYKQSALQGDAKAQYNLARFYLLGQGGEQDHKLAWYWHEQSACQSKTEGS